MKKKINIYAFIQARQTSKRLPNKIFLKLNKHTILKNIYLRLKKSKFLNNIVYLIPKNSNNTKLKNYLKSKKYKFFCGDEHNVLKRYHDALKMFNPDVIVRITSDCPLVDYRLLDKMISKFLKFKNIDYFSNTIKRSFPDGLDIEIFTKNALKITYKKAKKKYDLEHVTPYMQKNLKVSNFQNDKNYSKLRWTLDTMEDYNKLNNMFEKFKLKTSYSWKKILNYENS